MKRTLIILAAIAIALTSCKKDPSDDPKTTPYDDLNPQKQSWGL